MPNEKFEYAGTEPEKQRIEQIWHIVRSLLGSNDPRQMDIPQENWKRTPQDLMPEFGREGYIGRTLLPNEQVWTMQLLQMLDSDPVFSKILANEYERRKTPYLGR